MVGLLGTFVITFPLDSSGLVTQIVSFLLQLKAKGNSLIENLFDQRIELNSLHQRLGNEIKPLEDKLAIIFQILR